MSILTKGKLTMSLHKTSITSDGIHLILPNPYNSVSMITITGNLGGGTIQTLFDDGFGGQVPDPSFNINLDSGAIALHGVGRAMYLSVTGSTNPDIKVSVSQIS